MLKNFHSKILIPVSSVLMLSLILFAFYIDNSLFYTYQNNRSLALDRNQRIIEQAVTNLRQILINNRKMISKIAQSFSNATETDRAIWNSIVNDIGQNLEYDFEISDFHLYDFTKQSLISHGDHLSISSAKELISTFDNDEQSNYYREYIRCQEECVIYVLEPLRHYDQGDYMIFIGFEIYHLIDKISESIGSEIALLKTTKNKKENNQLFYFDMQLDYTTNSIDVLPVIEKARNNIKEVNEIKIREKTWDLHTIPLNYGGFSLLIITDITSSLKLMTQSRKNSLLILAGIFISLLLLLFFLLKKPLNRLKLIGTSIPLLGSSQFKLLRDRLGEPDKNTDELTLIHQTAYEVSIHLQNLENEQKKNSAALSEALLYKSEQYAFLKNLLDQSQIIIIVHDHKHHITMINRFSEKYINHSLQEAIGKKIYDVFDTKAGKTIKSAILSDTQSAYYSEHQLSQDMHYWVSWIHCNAPGELYLSIGIDVTDRHLAEQKMKYLAEIDTLTGLYNRRTFTSLLSQHIKSTQANQTTLALLFIDLDKFKQINDRLGHHIGDIYLKEIANIIKHYNSNTISGRLGGDEFAIMLKTTLDMTAFKLAEVLIKKINHMQKQNFDIGIQTSASIGIAFYPDHAQDVELLISKADLAMYRAKSTFSENICIYSPDINNYILTKFDKRNFLSRLIANDEIEVYLQAVLDKSSNLPFYYECLSREKTPSSEDSSGLIFKYADECGFASELDLHILRKAIIAFNKQLALYPDTSSAKLGINLSAQSIALPDFGQAIEQIIRCHNISYNKLIFEITETSEILNLGQAYQFINTLRKQGAMVALDDFGDGFASLRYLRNLPFDLVKVDGQFVMNIDRNRKDQIIVNSLIDTAKQFDLKIVIECVETESVHDYFQALNIDYLQGYYYGKPCSFQDAFQKTKKLTAHKAVKPIKTLYDLERT